jgi:hypothetical protein
MSPWQSKTQKIVPLTVFKPPVFVQSQCIWTCQPNGLEGAFGHMTAYRGA